MRMSKHDTGMLNVSESLTSCRYYSAGSGSEASKRKSTITVTREEYRPRRLRRVDHEVEIDSRASDGLTETLNTHVSSDVMMENVQPKCRKPPSTAA